MKKRQIQTVIVASMLLLTGCGKTNAYDKSKVTIPEYERYQYETYVVERGNFVPELTVDISAEKFEKKSYWPIYDNMEVNNVYVSAGDHVDAGEVLIDFKSGDIQDQIDSYLEQIGEQQLLLEHYNNLKELDTETDYTETIERLQESISVNSLYVNELRAKLSSYSVIAETDGTVYNVANGLEYSTVDTNVSLITVIYGNDTFTTVTSENFDFKEGDVYYAKYGAATYEMILTAIEETGKDADGNIKRKLTFMPSENTDVGYRDTLSVTFKRDELKNVIYVPKNCVVEYNNKSYVFVIDENGFRNVKEVVCGDVILDNVVITSGLTDGELVVLP